VFVYNRFLMFPEPGGKFSFRFPDVAFVTTLTGN